MVCAIALGWPTDPVVVQAFGTSSPTQPGKVAKDLFGSGESLNWKQMADGLHVQLPGDQPAVDYAAILKISLT